MQLKKLRMARDYLNEGSITRMQGRIVFCTNDKDNYCKWETLHAELHFS